MAITDFIINDIKPVPETHKIEEVQSMFSQTTYSHIPISRAGFYLGCLAEADTHCYNANSEIGVYSQSFQNYYVLFETNWLSVLEAFAKNSTNLMPVLNEEGNYIGYYELADVLSFFGNTPFMKLPGNIIIVEKGLVDYSLSEISQIVESNDGKIMGTLLSAISNDIAQVSIKVGDANFNDILATYRRYGYTIVSSHQEDRFLKELEDRSRYLDKYLNI